MMGASGQPRKMTSLCNSQALLQDLKELLERSFEITNEMQLEDLSPGYFSGLISIHFLHMGQCPQFVSELDKRQ
jgi:hypothetical protein